MVADEEGDAVALDLDAEPKQTTSLQTNPLQDRSVNSRFLPTDLVRFNGESPR